MLPHFFHLVGSDRYLTSTEVEQAGEPHPLTSAAWDVYSSQFQGFTGATLDPLFHRLAHPSTRRGSIQLDPGTAVLVIGTGPSLHPSIDAVKRLAGRVRIFTSPRGAEALLPHGIVPDLVLVEHQTALDAHHSARHLNDCTQAVLAACPLVAADWRTPKALLAGISPASLFVPSPLPTWGLWPATAVAIAVEAGASRVALLGVDLGTATEPDPAHASLSALLGLIARLCPVVALDCGAGGATKRGWLKASIDEAGGAPLGAACDVALHPGPTVEERFDEARAALRELAPVIETARAFLTMASDARADSPRASVAMLHGASAAMMAWREDPRGRVLLQECLGLSFLPRLWRIGLDLSLGRSLWRPLMLASHELVKQADALAETTAVRERGRRHDGGAKVA